MLHVIQDNCMAVTQAGLPSHPCWAGDTRNLGLISSPAQSIITRRMSLNLVTICLYRLCCNKLV